MEPCARIHSELMKDQFENSAEADSLRQEYELSALRDLERAVVECDGYVRAEKERIRAEVRRKKPPLPAEVNIRISNLKKEAREKQEWASKLEDDQHRKKEELQQESADLFKQADDLTDEATKKVLADMPKEEFCEECGTMYTGEQEREAHLKYKIHDKYVDIRARLAKARERKDEIEKEMKEAKENERKKRCREELEKEEGGKDRKKDRDRSRSRDRDRGKEDREKKGNQDREKKGRGRSRSREDNGRRDKKGREDSRKRDRARSRSRKKGRSRSRSRRRR